MKTGRITCMVAPALLALALVVPTTARAAAPIHSNFSGTQPNVPICDLTANVTYSGSTHYRPVLTISGTVIAFSGMLEEHEVFTAANGKAVEVHVANPVTSTATQNPDGTYTVVVTYRGQTDTVSIPHGPVLLMDTGMISSVLTLDSSGNFLNQTLITEHGPHPLEDSDLDTTGYALLCQTIDTALS